MSEGAREVGEDTSVARRGVESADKDKRGPTSSGGPKARLRELL